MPCPIVRHGTLVLFGVLLLSACVGPDRRNGALPRTEPATVAAISVQAKTLRTQQPTPSRLPDVSPTDRPRSVPVTGLLVDPGQLPASLDVESWCRDLAQSGVTTVVLEAWTTRPAAGAESHAMRPMGLYFPSSLGPMVRDVFGALIPAAHRHGLAVYASVGLRRPDWLDAGLGWFSQIYDPRRQAFRATDHVDLFHPVYQEFLGGLLKDLAGSGVDGLVFRADRTIGPSAGATAFGLRGFERDFGFRPDPIKLLGTGGGEDERASEFWQWVGWETRESQHVLNRLASGIKVQWPNLKVILEVHHEAIVAPVQGLTRHGEDVLEAIRGGYAALMVADLTSGGERMITRMKELVGAPERVWVLRPLAWRIGTQSEAPSVTIVRDRDAYLGEVGLIYYAAGRPTLP
ncbi:MAG: hypothetical protein E8D45_06055 [Nitrospira sp.]|nr:MAG: hypothetical protein E8D45_06055 [Nitrospira sp.]